MTIVFYYHAKVSDSVNNIETFIKENFKPVVNKSKGSIDLELGKIKEYIEERTLADAKEAEKITTIQE